MQPDDELKRMRKMTRRSFAFGAGAGLAAFGAWKWLDSRGPDDRIAWPLRRSLEANDAFGEALFSEGKLAPEFPTDRADAPRVNGWIGYNEAQPKEADWTVRVRVPGKAERAIPLAEVKKLPRVDSTIEFKCVEGWSQVSSWSGFRLRDFLKSFDLLPPAGSPLKYLLLTTMDGAYQSALDLRSALHPQTLLADRLGGAPLTAGHGAPLRLVIPVKYGIKNIKWLAGIEFSEIRPGDYWTARGYDWYAGL